MQIWLNYFWNCNIFYFRLNERKSRTNQPQVRTLKYQWYKLQKRRFSIKSIKKWRLWKVKNNKVLRDWPIPFSHDFLFLINKYLDLLKRTIIFNNLNKANRIHKTLKKVIPINRQIVIKKKVIKIKKKTMKEAQIKMITSLKMMKIKWKTLT